MKFKVKLFDAEGKELEIENQVIGGILFESKESFHFFMKAIRNCLPSKFKYQVIPEKESNKNMVRRGRISPIKIVVKIMEN